MQDFIEIINWCRSVMEEMLQILRFVDLAVESRHQGSHLGANHQKRLRLLAAKGHQSVKVIDHSENEKYQCNCEPMCKTEININ